MGQVTLTATIEIDQDIQQVDITGDVVDCFDNPKLNDLVEAILVDEVATYHAACDLNDDQVEYSATTVKTNGRIITATRTIEIDKTSHRNVDATDVTISWSDGFTIGDTQ